MDSHVNYGILLWIACAQLPDYEIRVTETGIPFKTLFPESGSISLSSVKIFELTPAREAATRVLVPGIECPKLPKRPLLSPGRESPQQQMCRRRASAKNGSWSA